MNLLELKILLFNHPEKPMRFLLPNGQAIPAHYHITEVGHVRKDFIDCGGTQRLTSACVLQVWVANDVDHLLLAGKLVAILNMADRIMPEPDLPIEIEYEAPIISQFTLIQAEISDSAIIFRLKGKKTDCLAKESCGVDGSSCVSSEEDCCSGDESDVKATPSYGNDEEVRNRCC